MSIFLYYFVVEEKLQFLNTKQCVYVHVFVLLYTLRYVFIIS